MSARSSLPCSHAARGSALRHCWCLRFEGASQTLLTMKSSFGCLWACLTPASASAATLNSPVHHTTPHPHNASRLTVTKDGVEAILRICGGDMRKVLNILQVGGWHLIDVWAPPKGLTVHHIYCALQATSMSHDVVSAANVYICTGEPAPADIDAMVSSLLNDSFADCYGSTCKTPPDMRVGPRSPCFTPCLHQKSPSCRPPRASL